MSKIDDALKGYDEVDLIIPGFTWGNDTKEILRAAKAWREFLNGLPKDKDFVFCADDDEFTISALNALEKYDEKI